MPIWFAIVFGLIQGITEFLPVSSTAHLRIAPELFGQPDAGAAVTAFVQLGTLAAVLLYFARDLFVDLPRGLLRDPRGPSGRLVVHLIIGSLPIVVAALFLKDYVVGPWRSLEVVASALIVVGLVMWWVDARADARGGRTIDALTWRDALLIGAAQAVALVPGVSRSGATICMALAIGMLRPEAARFSFLLSIPAIGGAGLLEANDAVALVGDDLVPLVVATVVAALSGYLAIAWLLRFVSTKRLRPFAVYRVVLGLALFGWLLAGARG